MVKFDKRNLALEADEEEIIAADQERLVVDAFVRYRISDPLQFYRTLRDERTADDRLERLVNSSLRQVLGSAPSNDIISGRRGAADAADPRRRWTAARQASRLGIEIIDVRIRRADLPAQNQEAVYRRMQTVAPAGGRAASAPTASSSKREIIAAADRDVAITLATAAAVRRPGAGRGRRARGRRSSPSSFGQDPSFAAFYRSMQAYESALARGDTTMVLSPDSAFFRYFERGAGGG